MLEHGPIKGKRRLPGLSPAAGNDVTCGTSHRYVPRVTVSPAAGDVITSGT
ncbi:MAG: hypothetical protein J6K19_10940 [Prevotella sp.]|nr:hypothetical protein [Prevotella sp.]MBP3512541.1 hypothetical protein [Prevotella sp.]